MEEEVITEGAPSDSQATSVDPTKNLKEEFNRKLQNVQEANDRLVSQNAETQQLLNNILERLNSSSPAQQQSGQEDLEELRYSDPDKYIQIKERQMDQRIEERLSARDRAAAERQSAIAALVQEYPELNQPGSALYKKVMEVQKTIEKQVRETPTGYRLAVREAAAEVGVKPMSKRGDGGGGSRPQSDEQLDEFLGSGNNPPKKAAPKTEVSAKTAAIAKLFGMDTSDKKRMERIAKYAKRKNWVRYQGEEEYE